MAATATKASILCIRVADSWNQIVLQQYPPHKDVPYRRCFEPLRFCRHFYGSGVWICMLVGGVLTPRGCCSCMISAAERY